MARREAYRLGPSGLGQGLAVNLDLADCLDDVVHVAALGQQHVLPHADGGCADLVVAFEFIEAVAVVLQAFGTEQSLESARGDRFVEQAVEVLFMIAAATANALGVQRLDEPARASVR